jgi:pSer/pThr/pTyr-binding forkhead associated (FHA) protein
MSRHDSPGARLELCTEDKTVRIVPIGAGGIQIGRDPNVDLRFDDHRISRRHARIEPQSDGHSLRHRLPTC